MLDNDTTIMIKQRRSICLKFLNPLDKENIYKSADDKQKRQYVLKISQSFV